MLSCYLPLPEDIPDFVVWGEQFLERFGDPDEKATAERQIKSLKQTGSAAIYTSEFFQLASRLNWNDASLMSQYHEGLKEKVKDFLAATKYFARVDKDCDTSG